MKKFVSSIMQSLLIANSFAQTNLIPNSSFNNAITGHQPDCVYSNNTGQATPIQNDILDWKTTTCVTGVESMPDWLSLSCPDLEPMSYSDNFIYLGHHDRTENQSDAIRTGLLSTMNSSDNYLFRITYARVPPRYTTINYDGNTVGARIYLSKWSSNWCSNGWGHVRLSFPMYPPQQEDVWVQHWVLLNGPLLNSIGLGNIFSQLHNITIKCEFGHFYLDYVELSEMCENPLLIENHQFYSGQDEMPYKSGGTLRAGYDVGSPQPNGNVIIRSGANEIFTAATTIYLENGFTAEQGSNFETVIEPCDINDPHRDILVIDTIAPHTYLINGEIEIYDDHEETINCSDTIKLNGIDGDTVSYSSYHWNFGNGQTSNDKSVNIHYEESGSYLVTLILTDSVGVTDTLSKTYIVPDCGQSRHSSNAITQNTNSEIQIFPNPTSGKFNIFFPKSQSESDITIYDFLGKLIFQKNHASQNPIEIDLSDQPKGMYLVKVLKDGHISTSKIVYL